MSRGLRYRFRPRAVWIAVLATVAVLTGSALLPGGIAQAGSPGWKSLAPMIQTCYGEVAGTLSNGQIIVAGGVSWSSGSPQWLTEAELYNPTSNTWSPTRSMSDPTSSAGSAVATNGLFYVFGGGDGSASSSLQIYNPSHQSWSVGPSMPVSVEYVAGAALSDGDIMAIGGLTSEGTESTAVEAYDPTSSTWSALAPLPVACQSVGTATGANGDVYVVGGACGKTGSQWSKQLLIYNPETNTWTAGPSMPIGRGWPAVALGRHGKLYVAGGYNAKSFMKSVLVYDIHTGSWSKGPSLPFAEYQQAAVSDAAGIVVLGGCGGAAGTSTCPSNQAILHR